jgi:hypothetical protein
MVWKSRGCGEVMQQIQRQDHANTIALQQEIETWVTALARYDNNEFDDALKDFENISDTSKILFNMGVIHATLGEHEKAVSGGWQWEDRMRRAGI